MEPGICNRYKLQRQATGADAGAGENADREGPATSHGGCRLFQ